MRRKNSYRQDQRSGLARRNLLLGGMSITAGGAAFLLACGGDSKESGGSSGGGQASTTQGTQAATGQAAGAAKYGGTLTLAHTAEAITLDPHTQESYASQYPVMQATNGILWLKPSLEDPADWKIDGDLAQSWEQPDQQTYVIKVVPGVKFHNLAPVNGRALTAEDIKYNIQRMATPDPKFRLRTQFDMIDKIDVVDPQTVRFTTKFPYAAMIFNLTNPWANMLAREVVEAGDVETKLIGTGPFMLTRWAKDQGLFYDKNPEYFKKDPWTGAKLPYVDKLELINLFDVSTQLAALRAGKIAMLSAGPERRQDLKRTNSELVEGPEVVGISIAANVMMNTRQKPFDDVRLRQAVMWATERSSYWLSVAAEGVPTGPMSSGTKPWRLSESDLPKLPDLTKAKQLLAAAGQPNGFQVTSTSTAPYSSPQYTEVTKGQLAKVGININIETVDNATWLSRVYRGQDYQTSSYGDYAFDDPDRGLYDYYHSKGGANHTNLNDAQLDQLLERQRSEMDYDKRRATVLEAQRRLIELAPRVFIHNAITRSLYQPWFKGFREISAAGSAIYRNYQFSWVDKG